jgi:hypothetical protein
LASSRKNNPFYTRKELKFNEKKNSRCGCGKKLVIKKLAWLWKRTGKVKGKHKNGAME